MVISAPKCEVGQILTQKAPKIKKNKLIDLKIVIPNDHQFVKK